MFFHIFVPSLLEALLLAHDLMVGNLVVRNNDQVVEAVGIYLDRAELAGGDFVLEEDVEFGVGETCDCDVSDCSG
jgi:hypothetical protein